METRSTARYQHISPQKCRRVADQVRNLSIGRALEVLRFLPNKGAGLVLKTLEAALANAEHNHGADIDDLQIRKVTVDEGPVLKRFRARARGRASRILKRTSHITVVLGDANKE